MESDEQPRSVCAGPLPQDSPPQKVSVSKSGAPAAGPSCCTREETCRTLATVARSACCPLPTRAILNRISRMLNEGQPCEQQNFGDNQCGFVAGCCTVDAIHAACLLIEKHREKQRPAQCISPIAYLDLEKPFDRVPRAVIMPCVNMEFLKSS
ncbi:unnamed protein product [Heligmosomoides polygyrus]|uniref:Clip domain-containing protein n=1 Tax=Heligmosomoides polygyrus TaxID=6339 RepID=A0A183GSF0_HELPZ|nr:unnamed protein product [Heligmosomoides polygyrus]